MLKKTIIDVLRNARHEKNIIFVQIADWAHMLVIPPSFDYSVDETRQVVKEIQSTILLDQQHQNLFQSILWDEVLGAHHQHSPSSSIWDYLTKPSPFLKAQVAFFVDSQHIRSKLASLTSQRGYSTQVLSIPDQIQIENGQYGLNIDAIAIATHCLWTCTEVSKHILDVVRSLPSQFRLFHTLYRSLGTAFPKASFWRADHQILVMQDKLYSDIAYQKMAACFKKNRVSPMTWLQGLDLKDLLSVDEHPVISVRSKAFKRARPSTLCETKDEYLLAVEIENNGRLKTVPKLSDDKHATRMAYYTQKAFSHLDERHYTVHAWMNFDETHFGLIMVGDKIASLCAFPELIAGALDANGHVATHIRAICTCENSIVLTEPEAPWQFVESLATKSNTLVQTLYPDGSDPIYLDKIYPLNVTPCGTFQIHSVPAPFFDLLDTANDSKTILPPGRPEYLRGLAYELIRNWKLATKEFKRAYQYDSSDGDISFAVGRTMSELHQHKAAIPFLKRAFDILPNDPDVASTLGLAYLACQDRTNATEFMEHAVALEPNDAQLLANLGRCYFSAQKWNEAETVLTKALGHAPNLSEAHATLAQLRWRLGDIGTARKHARKAFASDPGNRMVQELLWALSMS